jgi:hypothetical protein
MEVAPEKPLPLIVTLVPTGPLGGEKLVIDGAVITVKLDALVVVPPGVVTEIAPVVAVAGTVAVICESLVPVIAADTPLNFTAVAPVNAFPVIVTVAPTRPLAGAKLLIDGFGMTVKSSALVPVPAGVVTAIFPVVAPYGTIAVMCVSVTSV